MINKLKNNKGITLIALVITIIVLLILVGIAISMLTGENGILEQAAKAKAKTDQASVEEKIKLAVTASIDERGKVNTKMLSSELEKIDGEKRTDISLPFSSIIQGEFVSIDEKGNVTFSVNKKDETIEGLIDSGNKVNENTILEDTNKNRITVPKNFKLSKDSPKLVTEGMIIEDSEENQYIWIPVEANFDDVKSKTEHTDDFYQAIEEALKEYTKTYKDTNFKDVWYGDENYGQFGYYDGSKFIYYTNGNMNEEEYNNLYQKMLKSVYKNKGFYIGRYEMGIDVVNSADEVNNIARKKVTEYSPSTDVKTSTRVNENAKPSIEGMKSPISKVNAVPYNYITQIQAQMLAEKLGEKTEYSNVNTSIMFGVQWDAVCVFIEKYDKNNTATTKSD